jgi:hypothetical protein
MYVVSIKMNSKYIPTTGFDVSPPVHVYTNGSALTCVHAINWTNTVRNCMTVAQFQQTGVIKRLWIDLGITICKNKYYYLIFLLY